MYTIRFGRGWAYSVQTDNRSAAVLLADALALKGWGVHVLDPDGQTVPWRTLR